jgi:putative spermidine/putrescine transport system substrate-binding protein/putrescine transport system substrate-binding protein
MINRSKTLASFTLAGLALAAVAGTTQAAQTVTIANWSGYIAEDTLANFTS